jgi:O-antigen/teichoic acid export membrane protein
MTKAKKRVVKDALIYTILPKIYVFANLLITPLVSPYLTLNDFGIYGLLMAYLSVFQILINLGQNVVLQNSFFEYKHHYVLLWRRVFGMMIIAGAACAVIFSFILYYTMGAKIGANFWPVCTMVSVYLMFSPIETMAVNYYVLHERSLPFAICSIIVGSFSVIINYVLIRVFHLGYMGWVAVLPMSALIMYLYYFKRFFLVEKIFPVFSLKKSFAYKALRVGLPLTPHQLSLYILGSSDRILLEYFRVPTATIGYYSQGYNLASYGNVFIGGVFQALARRLQEGFRGQVSEYKGFIRKTMILTCVLISTVLFLGSLWMKEAFLFLFRKPELQQAYPVAIVVMCSYMFWSTYTFFTYPLSIQKKTFSISRISLFAAVINLVINIFLIPVWGIWAAVATTYFSYMIFGVAGILNKKNREFLNAYMNVTRLCLGTTLLNIAFFVMAYLCKDNSYVVKILLSLSVLLALAGCYKVVSQKNSKA